MRWLSTLQHNITRQTYNLYLILSADSSFLHQLYLYSDIRSLSWPIAFETFKMKNVCDSARLAVQPPTLRIPFCYAVLNNYNDEKTFRLITVPLVISASSGCIKIMCDGRMANTYLANLLQSVTTPKSIESAESIRLQSKKQVSPTQI